MAYGIPAASLSTLNSADGSSTVTIFNYTGTASVNGPIEVQRRDELPEEAALEINIRPSSGVHSPREAHLEALVASTLRSVILVERFPRTLIQVTLQILGEPDEGPEWKYLPKSEAQTLMVLPSLLEAALLAVMDANLPLSETYRCAVVAAVVKPSVPDTVSLEEIDERSEEMVDVQFLSPRADYDLSQILSLHVFSFTGDDKMVFCESEGSFKLETWEKARGVAEQACRMARDKGEQVDEVRGAVVEKAKKEYRWTGNV